MNALIKFISLHGNRAIDNGNGTFTVYSQVCCNGVAFEEKEIIPATMKAVRDWLGY